MSMPLTRLVGFVSHLRTNGIDVGHEHAHLAVRAVQQGALPGLREARTRLRIVLTSRREDWARFDDLFEAYFQRRGRTRIRPSTSTAPRSRRHSRSTASLWSERAPASGVRGDDVYAVDSDAEPSTANGRALVARAASMHESRTRVDLRHVADRDEMAAAEAAALRIARALVRRSARRHAVARRGRRVDLRRTARRALSTGGDPARLVWRRRVERPVRLVVLLDVSGSMQPYVRYLLQFVRGLSHGWRDTDVYLFHTRLVRITDVLREKDAMLAMSRLALMASGFGGGTRLSTCLKAFNAQHARRALNSRSVFVMVSDGYDTGDTQQSVDAFTRLRRRARRVLWLNPMLGWRNYSAETRTMQALLPYIDCFAPAHSLAALADVERHVRRLA